MTFKRLSRLLLAAILFVTAVRPDVLAEEVWEGAYMMGFEHQGHRCVDRYFVSTADGMVELFFTQPSLVPKLPTGTLIRVSGGTTNPTVTKIRVPGTQYVLTGGKWPSVNVSVSLPPDGTTFNTGSNNLNAYMNARFATPAWKREYARAVQTWASHSNLNFRFVTDTGVPLGTGGSSQGDSRFGDIRIIGIPEGSHLAFAYYPSGSTLSGDQIFNTVYEFGINTNYLIASTGIHETGHSLGIMHSDVTPSVMAPTYSGKMALEADDIAAIQQIYGARNKDSYDNAAANDTLATASNITLSGGQASLNGDLTNQADVDFYAFTAPSLNSLRATVSNQTSLVMPRISILNAAGQELASTSAETYGVTTTVLATGIVPGQRYYVRVAGSGNGVFDTGAYPLTVQFSNTSGSTPPSVATAASANPNPVTGTTTTLSVLGTDDGGESNLTYTWDTTATPGSAVTFSANGTNAAKNVTATFAAAGSYTLRATIRDNDGQTATSSVNVTVNATVTTIAVAPASASVPTGGTQNFTAVARDQFSAVLISQPAFTWSVSGGGTISSGGVFTAGGAAGGPHTVTASVGSVSGTASVTVTQPSSNPPTVASGAAATPNPVTGKTTALSVLGADDGGEPNLIYTWATSGAPPASVSFSANGTNAAKNVTATFSAAGSYRLLATIRDEDGQTATSIVQVTVNATITSVSVAPANTSVMVGGIRSFTAQVRDQFGAVLQSQPNCDWTTTGGGTVSSSGIYSAGSIPGGPFIVKASVNGVEGTASIFVVDGPPDPAPPTVSFRGRTVCGMSDSEPCQLVGLPEDVDSVDIYDRWGGSVRTVPAASGEALWYADDDSRRKVAAGLYVALVAGKIVKFVVVK